ncbi:MAG: tetratricopeptide repeat protein [Chloroflexi bacterium]|nr:tetratricopeptide repeat protein [Chloroflexota bacterium]
MTITDRVSQIIQNMIATADELYYQQVRIEEAFTLLESFDAWPDLPEIQSEDYINLKLKLAELLNVSIFIHKTSPQRVLAVLADLPDDHPDVLNMRGLAHYYDQLGTENADFSIAIENFLQALKLHQGEDNARGRVKTLFHIGLVHQFSRRPDEARDHFQQAYELTKEHSFPFEQSFAVRHLGFLADNPELTRQYLEESLQLREQLNCNVYLPFSHQSLAQVYLKVGDYDAAEQHLKKGQAIAQKYNIARAVYFIDMTLGDLYVAKQEYDSATDAFTRMKQGASDFGHEEVAALAEQRLKELAERG